jgi:hypothetical protein
MRLHLFKKNLFKIFQQWRRDLLFDWIVIEVSTNNENQTSDAFPYNILSFFYSSPFFSSNSSSSTMPTLTIVNGTNNAILPKPIVQEFICPKEQNLQKGISYSLMYEKIKI